ncbi:ArsR family transcriptional regulator [Paenibacillus sp. FSL R10-2734]|uniref:ArsR family transcriptional regulator n=1 Tax=Paenibacillus sp. FSL R10-2734 TaxID=2954691 RepID=UPI0030D71BC5
MSIRVGLLGPADAMEVLNQTLTKYPEFHCVPILCLTEEDLVEKVFPVLADMDMWLCTGPITYQIVMAWGGISTPVFHVPYHGGSFFKTLLQVVYKEKVSVSEISFDGFEGPGVDLKGEMERALQEADIFDKVQYMNTDTFDLDELTTYHYNLWAQGRTKAAITGHPIHEELQKRGVPAYRVLPPTMSIHSIANQMLRTSEMLFFKKSQITVQMVEIHVYEGMNQDRYSSDEMYSIEIEFTEKLLAYAKEIHGSLKTVGPGRYVIFTTRGLLEETTNGFRAAPDIHGMEKLGQQGITCGIGMGQTAYEAEINAGTALLHAKKCGRGSWMVCFDDKRIAGPLGKPDQLMYSYASEQYHEVSQSTTLSIGTLQKIKSVLRKRSSEEIGANELARYMYITERSARRILMELEAKGFAQVVAEEKPQTRGRPRKIYRILY